MPQTPPFYQDRDHSTLEFLQDYKNINSIYEKSLDARQINTIQNNLVKLEKIRPQSQNTGQNNSNAILPQKSSIRRRSLNRVCSSINHHFESRPSYGSDGTTAPPICCDVLKEEDEVIERDQTLDLNQNFSNSRRVSFR